MDTDENSAPKKYIRTFAGDMETMQKGGEPELTPLTNETGPVPPPPEPPVRMPSLAPTPIPSSNIGHVASSPLSVPFLEEEPAATTEPTPAPIPPPAPLPPSSREPGLSPIETYASDFSDHLKETDATPASILAAEQDAGSPSTPQPAPASVRPSRSGAWYIAGGAVLIVIASVVAFLAYARYASSPQPIVLAPDLSVPITVDERAQVSGTGEALMGSIAQSVRTPIKEGTVRLLYLAASTTATSVFSSLDLSTPDILARNVNAAGSMAGVIVTNGVQSPFFILSVASYGDTFSGMLSWEPDMPSDLSPLFPAYAPTVASTSATSSAPAQAAGFRDEVVGNHDVRVYRDAQGQSVILYGYWNQGTLVIARDPEAFSVLLERLAASAGTHNGS